MKSNRNDQDLEEYINEHREGRRLLGPPPPRRREREAPPAMTRADPPSPAIARMFDDFLDPDVPEPPRDAPPVSTPPVLGPPLFESAEGLIARTFLEDLMTRPPSIRAYSRLSRATGDDLAGVEQVMFPGARRLNNMSSAEFVLAGRDGADQLTGPAADFELRSRALGFELVGFACGPFLLPRLELVRRMPGCALVLAAPQADGAEDLRIVAITWLDEQGRVPAYAYGLIPHSTRPIVVRAPTPWFGIHRGLWFNPLYFFVQVPPNQSFALRPVPGIVTRLAEET